MCRKRKGRIGPIFRTTILLASTGAVAGLLILFSTTVTGQAGQSPTVAPPPPLGDDSDPTRPVIWSLREEYTNLPGTSWNNAFLVRYDHAFLRDRRWFAGKRGMLTRVDVPFVLSGRPDGKTAGLGDIYAQALSVPYITKKFAFAAGSGIFLPTATDRRLGTGKLTLAPAVAPVWFMPKRGFFFVKVQDYFSVIGAHDRPDLHYMTITPLLVWRLKGTRYWTQIDAETRTDWKAGGHTGYKTGILLGRMNKKLVGAWIKVEVGMGAYRTQTFAIKTSIFKVH